LEKKVFIITWDRESLISSLEKMAFRIGKICSVDGCEKQASAKGECNSHYLKTKWLEAKGDQPIRRSPEKKITDKCIWEGCEKPIRSRNLCFVHNRWQTEIEEGKASREALEVMAKRNKHSGRPASLKIACSECGSPDSCSEKSPLCPKCYGRWYRAQNPDKRLKKNQD